MYMYTCVLLFSTYIMHVHVHVWLHIAVSSSSCRNDDQTVPPGGDPKLIDSSSSSVVVGGAKSADGVAPPGLSGTTPTDGQGSSSSTGTADPSPFDPFSAAANEDTRRLQGM